VGEVSTFLGFFAPYCSSLPNQTEIGRKGRKGSAKNAKDLESDSSCKPKYHFAIFALLGVLCVLHLAHKGMPQRLGVILLAKAPKKMGYPFSASIKSTTNPDHVKSFAP
jgi:hypothetical protein